MVSLSLSPRSTLGPRGLQGGAIAGAVVGSVVGAALILLICIVPLVLRKRRQWRIRNGLEDGPGDASLQAEMAQSPSPGGRSSSTPQLDESKGLQADHHSGYSPVHNSGPPNGQLPNSNSIPSPRAASDHPQPTYQQHSVPPTGQAIDQGTPSPTSSLRKTPDPTQAYPTPPPDPASPPATIQDLPSTVGRESTRELSFTTDSYGPPSRELTGITSSGLTEEPESIDQTAASPSHRHFPHISGSIRSLLHKQHRRRSSRRSTLGGTDGARSPTTSTIDPISQTELVQPVLQEADINAPGLAWSYYNDPDLVSEEPQGTTYKPPAAAASTTRQPPLTLIPPAHATGSAPLSPVSLSDQPVSSEAGAPQPMVAQAVVGEPELISPDLVDTPLRPFSHRQTSLLRGPGSLARTDSLPPLQPIWADVGDNFAASPAGPSGPPSSFMGPTNEVEKSWRVDMDYLKHETPSPPAEPPLVYEHMNAAALTPMNPPMNPSMDPSMDPTMNHPMNPIMDEYYMKPTPASDSDYHSPPEIALNDHHYTQMDFNLMPDPTQPPMDPSYTYFTPPPSIPSTENTPDNRIDYTASPSPRSDIDQRLGIQLESSPRFFPCDYPQCNRVFDQVHKLNHHKRYHDRPHECTHPGCTMRFGTKTHLDRHVNDKHNKTRKFHCTQPDCPWSRQGGKSFPRKDNWRRHMMNKHHITPQSDPIEYGDETMMGT